MADDEPLLRVVRGTPTAEEVAALVGAILLRTRPATSAPPAAVSTWALGARPGIGSGMLTRTGRDAWRVSGLPIDLLRSTDGAARAGPYPLTLTRGST